MQFDPTQLPSWFLVFLVFILGGYFAWSFPKVVDSLKLSLSEVGNKLEKISTELFRKTDNHETRLSHIEGEHESAKAYCPGGRWDKDPNERP